MAREHRVFVRSSDGIVISLRQPLQHVNSVHFTFKFMSKSRSCLLMLNSSYLAPAFNSDNLFNVSNSSSCPFALFSIRVVLTCIFLMSFIFLFSLLVDLPYMLRLASLLLPIGVKLYTRLY